MRLKHGTVGRYRAFLQKVPDYLSEEIIRQRFMAFGEVLVTAKSIFPYFSLFESRTLAWMRMLTRGIFDFICIKFMIQHQHFCLHQGEQDLKYVNPRVAPMP
jgi:hypothetical protein